MRLLQIFVLCSACILIFVANLGFPVSCILWFLASVCVEASLLLGVV